MGNENRYIERHQQHITEVRRHFENRPEDLLELNLTAGEGWECLCPFLGRPIPPIPFPHANRNRVRIVP